MKTALSVNLNKIALLRNQRDLPYPSVVGFARTVLAAGAAGVTVHPRPDERHIRRSDITELSAFMALREYPEAEFNIEGYPSDEFLELVETHRPDQVTLVPDTPEQSTSDHGWDFSQYGNVLPPIIARIQATGSRVSLFVDGHVRDVTAAATTGAERIEMYTEPYAMAHAAGNAEPMLTEFADAARTATQLGLGINAGHDLSLANLGAFLNAVPGVLEISIGHAITAEALDMGMSNAVRAYLELCADSAST
jgi:pyridoxine 5-phosphate synthase